MDFRPLKPADDLPGLRPFFIEQPFRLSDYTCGFQIMWSPYAQTAWAVCEDCLVLRTRFGGKTAFNYPLHPSGDFEAEQRALDAIEAWCVENGVALALSSLPAERLAPMAQRYGRSLSLANPRTWRDYLYAFSDFATYAGKRFAGQRNHVSKFRRLYPQATFRRMEARDIPAVLAFLREQAQEHQPKDSFLAQEERVGCERVLSLFGALGFCGGLMELDGRILGVTVGEVAGDTLVVHIEKALRAYEGLYPALANAFALSCQSPGLLYINREDDAGDCGLRKSKLQYNPVRLLDKYLLTPRRVIEDLEAPPVLHGQGIELRPVPDGDARDFGRLARDVELNRYWGWDWRTAWKEEGDPSDAWFLGLARRDFRNRREISLGIYRAEGGPLLGEAVFHNFTYHSTVELGVRLLPEHHRRGYATQAMRLMADHALCYWGLDRAIVRCFRENCPSHAMLQRAGFRPDREDETFFWLARTAKS